MIDPRSKLCAFTQASVAIWDIVYLGIALPLFLAFQHKVEHLRFNASLLTILEALMMLVYSWHIISSFSTGMVVRYGLRRAVVLEWKWVARRQLRSMNVWLSVLTVAGAAAGLADPDGSYWGWGIIRLLVLARYLSR